MSDEEMPDVPEEEAGLTDAEVVTKYKLAGEITNKALKLVESLCVAGASVVGVCQDGDDFIEKELAPLYSKRKGDNKVDKGIAFPTCVSVNNCMCHYSPLPGDELVLAPGDIVKIDLGCHVDGYVAVGAHTSIVGGGTISGPQANAIAAARDAVEVALRLLKPGHKNTEITEALSKVATDYGCVPSEGILSHQLKRFIIDGSKVIISRSSAKEEQVKVEEFEFEAGQVFALDVVMSTGTGLPRETEARTTIFKRKLEHNYQLKMKASRSVFSEINQKFPTMPFTLRALAEQGKAKLGMTELISHDLVAQYPVLYEKEDAHVAQLKCTVLIMPNGSIDRITGVDLPDLQPSAALEDAALKQLMEEPLKKKKAKKAKK